MSHHRGNGHLCVPIQQSPPNGFRVKCPVRGLVLPLGRQASPNRRFAEVFFNYSNMAARDSRAEKPVQGGGL
jgi:hypothetical protein